jgi:hypothetical protein
MLSSPGQVYPGVFGQDILMRAADAGSQTQALRAEVGEQLRRCRELCREARALRDTPRPCHRPHVGPPP